MHRITVSVDHDSTWSLAFNINGKTAGVTLGKPKTMQSETLGVTKRFFNIDDKTAQQLAYVATLAATSR